MKLLSELIADLSREGANLTDALMKTKVLLHRLGRRDLAEWVNQELNGYGMETRIPEYRLIHAQVRGNAASIAYQFTNHPLPTMHLEEKYRKRFEELEIRDSIASLEEMARNPKSSFRVPIPLEANHLFDKVLEYGVRVQQAWSDIGHGQLSRIVTQVRSRLLDFLLELDEKIAPDMSEEDVLKLGQSPETASMFNHAIFGDNVTIMVGNHGVQNVSSTIQKGDFESLARCLRSAKLPDSDIEALRGAINEDATGVQPEKGAFGPRVREWMKSMVGKAIDGAWVIEAGVASGLLVEALKSYYG